MAQFMKTFRKNRKAWFAGLTIMVMFAFVFIPTIMETMQTGGRGSNPVVVKTTKYGSLTERQVQSILYQRQRLSNFLRQLAGVVQSKGGRAEAIAQALNSLGNSPADEEAAIDNWLLARRAEDLGLKVSEKAVNDYLASLAEGKAGNEDVREILKRLRMSQGHLFEGLRQEMLSLRLEQMFWISLAAATPAQRWEYYQQLNRRAKIEAVPVAAAKFVDKVPTPADDVLRDFFEKHKERLADPNSPEPGFREPHRVDIQYLKATVESFMEPAAVTEEAIRDYYEANKEQLYKDMLPEAPPPAAPKTEPPKSEPPKAEAPKSEPAKPAPSPKTEPAKIEPPKAPPKTEPPKAEPPKNEPPKTAPKAEPPKSAPEKSQSPAPVPGKTSSTPRRSPFRLVSEQKSTGPAPAAKSEPAAPKPAEPSAKTEPALPKLEPPAAKSDPAAPKPAQPAAKAEPAPPKSEAPAAKTASAAGPAPVKYKPLADVKDEIRKTLARQAAEKKTHEVLHRVQDRLAQFETQWTLYDTLEPDKKASTPPPARPDFVALAKEHRLTAAETGLMSALQMSGTDIGKSRLEGGAEFIRVAFEKSTPAFRPGISQDNEGNGYLFWEVHDTPERVPEFDEEGVRQQVLNAWKLVQARDLATKEAERLAAEARKANKALADAFAGRKDLQVLSPSPFTWLTFGNVPVWFRMRPPQYSEVAGIPGAGTEFIRAVFNLKAGEIGLATDQPKSTVYVVRLAEYSPSDSVLWDMFVADDYRGYAMAARYDQAVAARLWREGIRAEAGLKWQREPIRGRGEIEE